MYIFFWRKGGWIEEKLNIKNIKVPVQAVEGCIKVQFMLNFCHEDHDFRKTKDCVTAISGNAIEESAKDEKNDICIIILVSHFIAIVNL